MSDAGPSSERPARKPSAAGSVLRSLAMALLGSLVFGFAVGLWLRCQVERPGPSMLGASRAPEPARGVAAPVPTRGGVGG